MNKHQSIAIKTTYAGTAMFYSRIFHHSVLLIFIFSFSMQQAMEPDNQPSTQSDAAAPSEAPASAKNTEQPTCFCTDSLTTSNTKTLFCGHAMCTSCYYGTMLPNCQKEHNDLLCPYCRTEIRSFRVKPVDRNTREVAHMAIQQESALNLLIECLKLTPEEIANFKTLARLRESRKWENPATNGLFPLADMIMKNREQTYLIEMLIYQSNKIDKENGILQKKLLAALEQNPELEPLLKRFLDMKGELNKQALEHQRAEDISAAEITAQKVQMQAQKAQIEAQQKQLADKENQNVEFRRSCTEFLRRQLSVNKKLSLIATVAGFCFSCIGLYHLFKKEQDQNTKIKIYNSCIAIVFIMLGYITLTASLSK